MQLEGRRGVGRWWCVGPPCVASGARLGRGGSPGAVLLCSHGCRPVLVRWLTYRDRTRRVVPTGFAWEDGVLKLAPQRFRRGLLLLLLLLLCVKEWACRGCALDGFVRWDAKPSRIVKLVASRLLWPWLLLLRPLLVSWGLLLR